MQAYTYLIPFIAVVALIVVRQLLLPSRGAQAAQNGQKYQTAWQKVLGRGAACSGRECAWFTDTARTEAFRTLSQQDGSADKCAQLLKNNAQAVQKALRGCRSAEARGCFAFLLADLEGRTGTALAEYRPLLLSLLTDGSVYCRENALKALFACGDADIALEALLALNRAGICHHAKLVEEAISSFGGDRGQLFEKLMRHFGELTPYYRQITVQNLSLHNQHRWDAMLREGLDNEPVDMVCAVLRLLAKQPCEENKQVLMQTLARYAEKDENEAAPAFVAATALAAYPGDAQAAQALQAGLTSRHWQLRMNCAQALVSLKLPQETMQQLLATRDPYAREALQYALNRQQ